ncbi:MAG: M56 family metallopeptidase [Saprospiraceae bacterium]
MNSLLFLSDETVQALGWTLVHALWQGAAIALALWLVLPRLKSARQRYRAAYGALTGLALVSVATFALVYEPAIPIVQVAQPLSVPANGLHMGLIAGTPDMLSLLSDKLEACNPFIVAVWLPGFVFFLLRLATGLHYVHGLRSRQNRPAEARWQERLRELATRIGHSRPVGLLESALVRAPMAFGFFKPIILLPIGMTNQLSPAEVEAVLAHELAHLARRDWLFNLLQTVIEAVFYFHPAVWWIAALIRAERENCCDDTAVALTGNRLAYAKTLARLQEMARPAVVPAPALGLGGSPTLLYRRSSLLERIKRILHQPQQHTTAMEKTIALAVLMALAAFFTLRANTPPVLAEAVRHIVEAPQTWLAEAAPQLFAKQLSATDTVPPVPKTTRKIVHEDGDRVVEIEMDGNQISRLVLDGKEIPPAEYEQHRKLTEEILSDATPVAAPEAFAPLHTPFAPFAPLAPLANLTSTISTETDDEGNTVVRLEQDGKPVEIRVKDGEVWVDGKKLEKGKKLDLPGIFFWNGDNGHVFNLDGHEFPMPKMDGKTWEYFHATAPAHPPHAPDAPAAPAAPDGFWRAAPEGAYNFYYRTPEGTNLRLREFAQPAQEAKRNREEALRDLERQREQIERELRELGRERKQNNKELDKALDGERKAMREAQRAVEQYGKARQEAMERAQELQGARAEMLDRVRDNQVSVFRGKIQSTNDYLRDALLRDGLISDPDKYSMEFTGKYLRVNGKKQPDEVHERYLELYHAKTGKTLDKKDMIRVEVSN